jgi:dCMP deaminase
MRPSWHEYFKEIASVTAKRSSCDRLHVGCVLVRENRIISQGYNGFLPGCSHKSVMKDGHEQATVHAEQNAITDCARRGVSCYGAIAYITHYPCINCMKIMCASGISKIYYENDYRNDEIVEHFSREANVSIVRMRDFSLENTNEKMSPRNHS